MDKPTVVTTGEEEVVETPEAPVVEENPSEYEITADGDNPETSQEEVTDPDVAPVIDEPVIAEPAIDPLTQYIGELEAEVGTRRGENETVKEYALRMELTRTKRNNKKEDQSNLFNKPEAPAVVETNATNDDILSQYDEAEISNFEKIFDAVAEKKGFVRKHELQATTWDSKAKDNLDDFLLKNKEYNDPALWEQFRAEFDSGKYNKRPANPSLLKEIFSEIHSKLVPKAVINKSAANANNQKVNSLPKGGSTAPGSKKEIDPALKEALKGFTDEELLEMSQ